MTDRKESRLRESQAIFDNDPLLLKSDSHEKYRKLILKNLLVNRTLATSVPLLVDLHDPDSCKFFLKRWPSPPQPPSAALAQRYYDTYKTRIRLDKAEMDELQKVTMLANAKLTDRRGRVPPGAPGGNPATQVFYKDHDAAESDFETDKAKEQFRNRFRIATIGHRVRISKLENASYLNEDLYGLRSHFETGLPVIREPKERTQLGRTRRRPDLAALDAWEGAVERNVANALKRRSQIILLPEFALPPARPDGDSIAGRLRELSLAAGYNHFIQAGTRHEGRHNRGLVLCNDKGSVCPDWWHYKAASAKGLHENIMGPYGEKIPTYRAKVDNLAAERTIAISVAVCFDAFDPTMFLTLLLNAFKHTGDNMRHVLLVPSFNPSSDFVAMLRDFSFLAQCIVVYVNALHGDSELFISGFSATDFADRSPEIINSIETTLAELQAANMDATDDFSNQATRLTAHSRSPAEREKDDERQKQIKALTNLRACLLLSQQDGAFKHVITCECCPNCDEHKQGDHCERDTLYFNIDPALIGALDIFRSSNYFDEKKILPEPYWQAEIKESVGWLNARVKRLQEEYERE